MKRIIMSLLLVLFTNVFASGQESQNTKNSADQMLRSNGTVNPSTLGLEMSIPLGSYPGRGINLPLGLSYSSKLWRFEAKRVWVTPYYTNGCGPGPELPSNGSTWTYVDAQYSENASAGWASSIAQPYIEYTGEYVRFNDRGTPIAEYFTPPQSCSPSPPQGDNLVKRITVYLPGGASYELRDGDAPIPLSQYTSSEGTYLSADGSGLRYEEHYSTGEFRLYMADGSFYDFRTGNKEDRTANNESHPQIRRAAKLTDPHGNFITFDEPPTDPNLVQSYPHGSITDQLGRKFPVMVPRDNLSAPTTQYFTLPGMTNPYKLNWQRLNTVFTPNREHSLKYKGDSDHWITNAEPYGPTLFPSHLQNGDCNSDELLVMADQYANQTGEADRFNPVVLADLTLPNGAKYKFTYNDYGEIETIQYPTGGREEMSYSQVPSLAHLTNPYQKANRGVVQRDVYESVADTVPDRWIYGAVSSAVSYVTTVEAPDHTKAVRYMHRGIPPTSCSYHPAGTYPSNENGLGWGYDNVLAGRPYDESLFSADGDLVQRTRTKWGKTQTNTPMTLPGVTGTLYVQINPRVEITKSITYEGTNGVSAITKLEYANTNSAGSPLNVINKYEYSYDTVSDGSSIPPSSTPTPHQTPLTISDPPGSLPIVRLTHTDYKTDASYLARGFLKLPISVVVTDSTNNSNSVKAKSEIIYDESSYLQTDSASGVPGWNAPEVAGIRGLPTTTKTWYDLSSNPIQTHVQYNQFGSPRKSWDGNWDGSSTWNFSEIQYNDNFSDGINRNTFAFPTKSISAPPNASATPFQTETKYRFETSQATSSKDINGQTTTVSYADPATGYLDPLLRIRKLTAPNGQQTITDYGQPDSTSGQYDPAQRFVKVSTQIDASNWKQQYTGFDGLGRNTRTQTVDNANNGNVFVDTEYDKGRVWKVSNPYRNIASPQCGTTISCTTNQYDTAGRLWKVTAPDSAPVITTYGIATTGSQIGTVTTVSDQAGKLRRSITDALGLLIRVDEPTNAASPGPTPLGPINSPIQPTYYEYDLLNNLTKVKQGGSEASPQQQRTFVYDALSRLKSASNPESGTISYIYDNNGNLTQKDDARGVRTTYIYDGLNRVTDRNYTTPGGTPPNYQAAPNVTYTYDNITNAKGKLTKVVTGSSSSPFSTTEYTSFDIMGRVTGAKQTTDGNQYATAYTYNLSGALIDETYPSGRVVKNTLDNNGDLSVVQSRKPLSSGSGGFWKYASNFEYTAAGAVTSMRLGNGLYEKTVYNNRLQPTEISLGSSWVQVPRLLKLNYSYGDWVNGSIDSTKNNGNIVQQMITVPGDGAFAAVQQYHYDSLNRIQQADEKPSGWTQANCDSNSTQCWKQEFSYDRYGNRNFVTGTGHTTTIPAGCSTAVCNPSFDTAKNQFASGQTWAYDSSGNTKNDANGKTFTYDGENKQVLVKNSSNVTIGQYFYDGDGKRVKKVVPSSGETETTIFVYDAGGKLVAEYSTNVLPVEEAKVAYLTNDHLGSPRINTDRDGHVISRHDYHPFGEEIVTSQRTSDNKYIPDSVRKQFTGYERDGETDLDFAQARMYSSRAGRFSSPDHPFADQYETHPQSWNLYIYVQNNPLIFVDCSGLWKQVECSSGMCWEAEKGDTFTSLAKLVDISASDLTKFFSGDDPNSIPIGHVFDLSGFQSWEIIRSFWSIGRDVQRYEGDKVFDKNDRKHIVTIPREMQPSMPTGNPIKDGLPSFLEGAKDGAITMMPLPLPSKILVLGKIYKLSTKIIRQGPARGWTKKLIQEAIEFGEKVAAPNKLNPGNGATRYIHPSTGQSVVIDNVTGDIIHAGGSGFKY